MAKAIAALADMGVWMTNVHASGGLRMMSAEILEQIGSPMLLIAVTVLAIVDNQDLREVGIGRDTHNQVLALANIAQRSGLDGVVCSALEAQSQKQNLGTDFKLVTPGIRLPENAADDQKRVVTPVQAVELGSDSLVVGRPITQAKDPVSVLQVINQSLAHY